MWSSCCKRKGALMQWMPSSPVRAIMDHANDPADRHRGTRDVEFHRSDSLSSCSPDGAQRNPGQSRDEFPDSGTARLHPGYGTDTPQRIHDMPNANATKNIAVCLWFNGQAEEAAN